MNQPVLPARASLVVLRSQLSAALRHLDFSQHGLTDERIELFTRNGLLVIRQGYNEQTVSCDQPLHGSYSIALTSLQKWDRFQRSGNGTETLVFSERHLQIGELSLPTKWEATVRQLAHALPRVIASTEIAVATPAPPRSSDISPAPTCVHFRINVKTEDLLNAFQKFAAEKPVTDIYMRMWSGNLILRSANSEVRLDAEGKFKGFAVIPAVKLFELARLQAGVEQFTLVTCESRVLQVVGHRIKLPAKGIPVDSAVIPLSAGNSQAQAVLRTDEPRDVPPQPKATAVTVVAAPTAMSLRVILAMADSLPPRQLAESGLSEIVAAAIAKRNTLIQEAVELLRPLEITSDQLCGLLKK